VYYTIPFKTDGSCCPTCPVVQGCNCEEGCCDPDASYTGKTMTLSESFANRYNAFFWNKDVSTFTGAYIGAASPFDLPPGCTGGIFSGTRSGTTYSGQYPDGGQPDCPTPPLSPSQSTYSDPTSITIFCCAADPGKYYIGGGFGGCSSLPCTNDGSISYDQTCAESYASSCFSISVYYFVCYNQYRENNCQDRYIVDFAEHYLTVSIA
jgi:hypothetical protein